MRKKFFKILIAIIVMFFIIKITVSYIDYRLHNIKIDVTENALAYLSAIKEQDGNIYIKDYLELDCDEFYVIGPYMTSSERHDIVGSRWFYETSYVNYIISEQIFGGDNINEDEQILIFVNDEKPIGIAISKRENGDLIDYENPFYDIDEILYNEKTETGFWKVNRSID